VRKRKKIEQIQMFQRNEPYSVQENSRETNQEKETEESGNITASGKSSQISRTVLACRDDSGRERKVRGASFVRAKFEQTNAASQIKEESTIEE